MQTKRPIGLVPATLLVVSALVTVSVLGWLGCLWLKLPPRRTVHTVERGADLRDCSVAGVDLRGRADLIRTLGFNLRTRWPAADRLPAGYCPGEALTNAMNPGLGLRELHREGITGKGVSVAIIDYPLPGRHPEYAGQLVEIHQVNGANGASMHGPAVASLLVGRHCGTAPGARLYYVSTPDPGGDARNQAEGLDWVLEKNKTLPPAEQIRLVSVSSGPSGRGSPFRNGKAWEEALERADRAGVLVVDGTPHHGFLGPCNLDPLAPDDPGKCVPIPSQRGEKIFSGRLLVPVSPRTIAEEYSGMAKGYRYCGWMDHTFGMFGTSWSMPYCAGVIALGWQVNPRLPGSRMKQLLFESAFVRADGSKVINPPAFIAAVRREASS